MKRLFAAVLLMSNLFGASAYAGGGRTDYLALVLTATVIASAISLFWVKKTPQFDNIHLKIIGFSVYFWIVMFAEVIVYGIYRYFLSK